MSDRDNAVQASGLTKCFGHRSVLRQISLHLGTGEVVALMGANGAGKTTLLGCLASIVRPTGGSVCWFGRPAADRPYERRLLGMVAHESRLYPQLTLQENLVFAGRMYGVDQPARRAAEMLATAGLAAHASRFPLELSRGMRQRVAVARALLHEPRILLLDEPFSGLDAAGAAWLDVLLRRLREAGRAICFTTHDAGRASRLADRIWQLQAGRLSHIAMVPAVEEAFWMRAA